MVVVVVLVLVLVVVVASAVAVEPVAAATVVLAAIVAGPGSLDVVEHPAATSTSASIVMSDPTRPGTWCRGSERGVGGTSAVFDLNVSRLLLVTGGADDKPAVTFAAPGMRA